MTAVLGAVEAASCLSVCSMICLSHPSSSSNVIVFCVMTLLRCWKNNSLNFFWKSAVSVGLFSTAWGITAWGILGGRYCLGIVL